MTSLSIRSNNAIKSSPGNGRSEVNPGSNVREGKSVSATTPLSQFLSKDHISQLAASIRRPELVLIFVISLCIFFGLLSLRVFDDNKLTSWHWIFVNADLLTVSIFLVSGLLAGMLFINLRVTNNQSVVFLILLSIVISLVHRGNPEVILDAGRYFSQAKYLEIYGFAFFLDQWGRGIMAWTDLPLVPLIYGVIFKVFGETRFGIQLINIGFFAGTVYLTYYLGRHLWNHRVGVYGASMLLAIPYLHTQVPLMMVDVPAMFFLTLAVVLYTRAVNQEGKWNITLAAAAVLLAMLAKYSNWLMLSILPVISIIYFINADHADEKKQVFRRSVNILVMFSLLAIIPVVWGFDVFLNQIGLLVNFQLPILNGWTESHISTFFYQMHPFIALSALFSLYLAYRRRDKKLMIIAWMLLLILAMDIERIRYLIIVFPMLALMAGYAIAHLHNMEIRRYLVLSILATASTVSVLGHASFLRDHSAVNMQAAANYVNALEYSGVEVVLLEQQQSSVNPMISLPLFDFYTQKNVFYRDLAGQNEYKLTDAQKKSTLRFTWEYKSPEYHNLVNQEEQNVIAVIYSDKNQVLPVEIEEKLSGYYRGKRFNKDEGIFRYKTIVDIYLPVGNGK